MAMLKGFINIDNYVDNTPGRIAPLGELSVWSSTYSRECGLYSDNTIPGYKLISFKHVNQDNVELSVPQHLASHVLEMARDVVSYAQNHIRPYDKGHFINDLLATHHLRAQEIEMGDFVDNGSLALPEWLSWVDTTTTPSTFVKIWFSDEAFKDQYDEYHITVIPPIEPIDKMFEHFASVTESIKNSSMYEFGNRIQLAKDNHPETYLRLPVFELVNRLNPAQKTNTTWGVLIYGKYGDYIDAIKDAIVDYIMENTEKTPDEWEVIFPDIFKRTEFVFLPRWDKYSIEDLGEKAGLYGNFINPLEALTFAKENISFYLPSHIEGNTNILPFDYRTLLLQVINGPNNIEGKEKIEKIFPDYIPVPTTNPDFGRMTLKTREWVLFMDSLLQSAEKATEYMAVGKGKRRITRGGVLFVTAMYDEINFLVAAKSNPFYKRD